MRQAGNNTSRDLGHNPDIRHSNSRGHRLTAMAGVNGFLLWRQIA
jgi:hypothetical protein